MPANMQIVDEVTIWLNDTQSTSIQAYIDSIDNNRVYWVGMPVLNHKKKYDVEIWKNGTKIWWARMSPKNDSHPIKWLYTC